MAFIFCYRSCCYYLSEYMLSYVHDEQSTGVKLNEITTQYYNNGIFKAKLGLPFKQLSKIKIHRCRTMFDYALKEIEIGKTYEILLLYYNYNYNIQ